MATTNWSVDPAAFADVVGEDLAKRRTLISLDTHKNIVLRNRVRTGHSRRNWVITYNREPAGEIGKSDGDPISEAEAIALANSAIAAGYKALLPGSKEPFTKVIISNNVVYVPKLEEMDAMVALTIAGINLKYSR